MAGKKKPSTPERPQPSSPVATDAPLGVDLLVGDTVEIQGLSGAKELNGRRGNIVTFVKETQRFGVRLEGEEETKAVKPGNLKRLEKYANPLLTADARQRCTLERELARVVEKLKNADLPHEEAASLKGDLSVLLQKLKRIDEEAAKEEARAAAEAAKPKPKLAAASPSSGAAGPAALGPIGPKPPPIKRGVTPDAEQPFIQPPPLPRDQHHPLPTKPKDPEPKVPPTKAATAAVPPRVAPRPTPPPELPERLAPAPTDKAPPVYSDEHEYPDPERAQRALRVVAGAATCGIVASLAELFPATWFLWSFLLVHLIGVLFLTDYAQERGLLVLCATFGLHAGAASGEWLLWALGRDGADSVGPWSILVLFACVGYLQNFWLETVTLPPDYINSISLWFPMFPAYNAAIALSCAELFLEWRYFPEFKIWTSCVVLGVCCMVVGQALIFKSCRTAGRNAWASCRNMPEDEEKPEDFVGLEIPDRRIVQDGAFSWERHPTYLGVMLWGVGVEIALCNPVMLLLVGFVLWASLLYVALEEEQELYDEFKGSYANYAALTTCWIPLFNSFLENAAFQREMSDNAEEPEEDVDEDLEEDEGELDDDEGDAASEDDLLPTWEGVPKGGALWNRQFRDPWMLG